MKFTKQYNLRIKREWIENAVDVAGVKKTCQEEEGEADKAESFLCERIEEARARVTGLTLPKPVLEVRKETEEASGSETAQIAAERITEKVVSDVYKQIKNASRFIEDVRDFQSLQILALEKLGNKYLKCHFPRPAREPEVPALATFLGSDMATPRDGADDGAAAGTATGGDGAVTKPVKTDPLGQDRDETAAKIKAFLATLPERPISDVSTLDELDRHMEEFLREVPARWRKRHPSVVEPAVPVVTKLDLLSLPVGRVSRLKLALGTNYLAYPHSLPVIVARGATAGPTVVITSAVHGNELNGIPLIHRLMRDIDCDDLSGILIAVPVVNVAGYVRQQRAFSDGVDINRIMPGKEDGNCSQQFAFKLMTKLLSKADYVLDMHTASFGRVNSLYVRADMNDPVTHRMAVLQRPQIIVHSTGPDGSLRGACMSRGVKAITVEIGDPHRFHEEYVKTALEGVHSVLSFLKVLPHDHEHPVDTPKDTEPVVCSKSFWIFTRHGGVLYVYPELCQWVRKGQVIAEIYDLYGDLVDRHFAPADGIIVGKSVNPVASSGDRVLHIGVVSGAFAKKADDGH